MLHKTLLRQLSGSAYALAGDTLAFYQRCERSSGIVRTHCWGLPVFIVTDPFLIEETCICMCLPAEIKSQRGMT